MICASYQEVSLFVFIFPAFVVGVFWLQHRLDKRRRDRRYGKERL